MARPIPAFWGVFSFDVRRDWSTRPLYDEYFREGRILETGTITYSLSDKDGNWVRSRLTLGLSDTDRLIRILLETDNYEHMLNRQALFYIQDEAGRRAGALPIHIFTGIIREPQIQTGMRAAMVADDWIGSTRSPFNPARKFPVSRLTRGMFPQLPDTLDKTVQRLICGIMSDVGTKDEHGNPAHQGEIIPNWVGKKVITTEGVATPPTQTAVYLEPPTLTIQVFGSGPTVEIDATIAAFTADGSTTAGNVVRVTNYPKDQTSSHYAVWTWTLSAQAQQYEDQIRRYGIYAKRVSGPAIDPRFYALDFNYNPTNPPQKSYTHNGSTPGDDHFGKTLYPSPPSTNQAQVDVRLSGGSSGPVSAEWDILFVCGHALNPEYIISYHWPYWEDGGEITRQQIPESAFGSEILAPGKPGWPHPTPYVDVTDSVTGKVHRCTLLYVRGDRATKHREGSGYFALNTSGMEDVGDGTGKPIRRSFFLLQHLLSEFVAANNGDGYYAGPWQGVPFFSIYPDMPMINTDLIQAAQAQTVEWIGGLGYVFDFVIDKEITVGELVRKFNVNTGGMAGTTLRGQFGSWVFDDTSVLTEGNEYREGVESITLGETEIAYNELENRIFYSYDFNPATGEYRMKGNEIFDQPSFDQYQEWHEVTLEFDLIHDPTTAHDVAARRLMRNKWRPLYQQYQTDLIHLRDHLGAQTLLTHSQGLGPNGYVQRPFKVTNVSIVPTQGKMEIRARDFRRILASAEPLLQDEEAAEYDGIILGDETSTALPPEGAVELR